MDPANRLVLTNDAVLVIGLCLRRAGHLGLPQYLVAIVRVQTINPQFRRVVPIGHRIAKGRDVRADV